MRRSVSHIERAAGNRTSRECCPKATRVVIYRYGCRFVLNNSKHGRHYLLFRAVGRTMRIAVSIVLLLAMLLNSGCAIYEKETTNRGGYLDFVLDQHWLKADSKGMRALRAFAMQVSLARIASVAAKNDSDRQLLAIRIGALTKRFTPIYLCAFDNNPLGVQGAERDPCFFYDSAMVDYSTGLFDLAMIALPIEDAIKYGRIVGALYRDTVELEVQLWLATPAIDNRPPPFRVTETQVAALRE